MPRALMPRVECRLVGEGLRGPTDGWLDASASAFEGLTLDDSLERGRLLSHDCERGSNLIDATGVTLVAGEQ